MQPMCGRYSFSTSREKLLDQFGSIEVDKTLEINFNIAPTQKAYVITDDSPGQIQAFRWGLIPFWAKNAKIGSRLINARSETVASKPSFRYAFKKRRCWVLADSFYEWKKWNDKKQPYRIFLKNGNLLVFAGLWEIWGSGEDEIRSFTILTTSPNPEMIPIHDRMPVVLTTNEQQQQWLEDKNGDAALGLLQPAPPDTFDMYPISSRINRVGNNEPSLHEPLEEQGDLFA